MTQPPVLDEPGKAELPGRIDEDDQVDLLLHMRLEEQWDVADHHRLAAGTCGRHAHVAQAPDLGVHHGVERLEFGQMPEHAIAERGPIETAVWIEDAPAPAGDDLLERWRAWSDGLAGEDVRVDERYAASLEQARHGRLAAADVPGESDDQHQRSFSGSPRPTERRNALTTNDVPPLSRMSCGVDSR